MEPEWLLRMVKSIITTVRKKMNQDQLITFKSFSFSPSSLFQLPVGLVLLDFVHPHQENVVVGNKIIMVERLNEDQQIRQTTGDVEEIGERGDVHCPPLGEDDERVLQPTEEPLNNESVRADVLVEVVPNNDNVWDEGVSAIPLVREHR